MRRLLLLLLVLLVAAVTVVDLASRRFAEGRIAAVVEANTPGASGTEVHVHGFAFVVKLLLGGHVDRVEVVQRDVRADGLTLDAVRVDVSGLDLDRAKLFARQIAAQRIDRGTASAELSEATLTSLVHLRVQLRAGKAVATLAGRQVAVGLRVAGGSLVLSAGTGVTVRVPVPVLPMLPCVSGVVIGDGRVELSCTLSHIPAGLLPRTTVTF